MILSPGKSILLYNPVLILLPISLRAFCCKHRVIALAVIVIVFFNLVFYSFYTTWTGDYAWGLRFQVPILPLLVLPLLELWDQLRSPLKKRLVGMLVTLSVAIQIASVVYNFNLEFVQNPNHCLVPDRWVWDWSQSHLVNRFKNIGQFVVNRRSFSSVPVVESDSRILRSNVSEQTVKNAYVLNCFPFKSYHFLGGILICHVLLVLWLAEWLLFVVYVRKICRCYYFANQLPPKFSWSQNNEKNER
jgi:hypothetical protein